MDPLRIESGLHITHGDHVVDLLNAKPMQHVRHQRLETHILDSSDELGGFEVLVCRVAATFAKVVHKISNRSILDDGCLIN